MNKVICLAGPTGCGKSSLAAKLGKKFGGAVVNADSRQVYADFPIITAQPGDGERELCPHFLYGFLAVQQKISAGQYAEQAYACIKNLWKQGIIPILTGGTGLYFRSLLQGIADIPQIDPAVHEKWQNECLQAGSIALHAELTKIDAEYAAKIHPNDRQRITRALEVYDFTGKNFTWWHQNNHNRFVFDYLYLGLHISLADLEPRLELRIEQMLEQGALEEAKNAMITCPDQLAPGWSGIGCIELYQYLSGKLALDEAKELWRKNTRAYAKRQITWFKSEKDIQWHMPEDYTKIITHISNFLNCTLPVTY